MVITILNGLHITYNVRIYILLQMYSYSYANILVGT